MIKEKNHEKYKRPQKDCNKLLTSNAMHFNIPPTVCRHTKAGSLGGSSDQYHQWCHNTSPPPPQEHLDGTCTIPVLNLQYAKSADFVACMGLKKHGVM